MIEPTYTHQPAKTHSPEQPIVMKRLSVYIFVLSMLGWATISSCNAQEGADVLRQANQAFQSGEYQEARQLYRDALEDGVDTDINVTSRYFETFLFVGEYETGLDEIDTLLRDVSDNPYALHMRGRLLAAKGRFEEAQQAYELSLENKPDLWRAVLDLGELLEAQGQKRQALNVFAVIYRNYIGGQFRTAETLSIAGRAAAALNEYRDANSAFNTAYQVDPTDVQNLYWWGELFREKYNEADALRTYEEALAVNPHFADVYVGMARSVNGFERKDQLVNEALKHNPNSTGALEILASLHIVDGLYDDAETAIRRALAVNPVSVPALAQLASLHFLRGDTIALAAVEQQALAVNPQAGDFYTAIVENCMNRFRYPDAEGFARQAIRVERDNWKAYATLGTSLLRVGKIDEARRYLEVSFDRDPFNLYAGNTLTLLDEYADFKQLESQHFQLLIHQDERDVLGPFILEIAEACYDSLRARYPYEPAGKISLEAYNDPDDFAVRIAGLPHLGLLGVSFGDVVSINTPRAQTGSEYNWARTLWHELAHTMAIGVSKHHVPRWFTEGLSVYEEQRARPEWGREMDLELFSALGNDQLLHLKEIDRGFTRPAFPGQVMLSYYQASKVIEFVVQTYGFGAITGILTALGQGNDIAAAVQNVLQQDLASLDSAFFADLRTRRDRRSNMLANLPNPIRTEEDVALGESRIGATENAFTRILQEGYAALEQEQYSSAEASFLRALEIYPDYIAEGNPYQGLAAVFEATGETGRRISILRRFLHISEYGAAEARELGSYYEESNEPEQATYYYGRSLEVEPYDLETRLTLAALYEQQGLYPQAVRERRAVLDLNPVDRSGAFYELALSLYHSRRLNEAKRAVLQSLELAPGYRDAQKLLLQCVNRDE